MGNVNGDHACGCDGALPFCRQIVCSGWFWRALESHLKKHLAFIPLEIRPERLGLPKCRVPSLPPYKMVLGHLQNGSAHGGCCLQNGGTRVHHLPTNIKYFGLT